MTGKENNLDRLSKNYQELDKDGKDALLKIGEKVLYVKTFVNKEISILSEDNNENEKVENE
jgi:hypothetical protein